MLANIKFHEITGTKGMPDSNRLTLDLNVGKY